MLPKIVATVHFCKFSETKWVLIVILLANFQKLNGLSLSFCHLIAVLGDPCSSSSTATCRCQRQQKAAGEDGSHKRRCHEDWYQATAAETAVRSGAGRAQLLRDPCRPSSLNNRGT